MSEASGHNAATGWAGTDLDFKKVYVALIEKFSQTSCPVFPLAIIFSLYPSLSHTPTHTCTHRRVVQG